METLEQQQNLYNENWRDDMLEKIEKSDLTASQTGLARLSVINWYEYSNCKGDVNSSIPKRILAHFIDIVDMVYTLNEMTAPNDSGTFFEPAHVTLYSKNIGYFVIDKPPKIYNRTPNRGE